jgi:AcrR family transcriptional regulator
MVAKRGTTVETKSGVSPRRKLTAASVGRKTNAPSTRVTRNKRNDVDLILDAASKLLTSKGLGALNMNAIAALATVDLPTLHTHFKDKTVVLLALYEKTMAERASGVFEMIQQLRSGTETETISWVQTQIDKLVDLQLENPEHVALRRAIRAVPELTAADERSNAAFAQAIDFSLRSVLPEMDARRTRSVARTVVEAGTALIEYCAMHPKEARGMSREIGVMVVGYIREVLKSV